MLGDIAAFAFQPIARGVDAVFGTDIQNCSGCKDRPYFSQRALNRLSDELFALFSRRARDNDRSPMDYTVTKQVTSQFLVLDAKDPDDAIEKAERGEAERTQSGRNWQAVPRQQQPAFPPGAVGGPVAPRKS